MNNWSASVCLAACIAANITSVQAGVVIGGTRVVYDGSKREAALPINNPEAIMPYLIQSWTQNMSDSDTAKVPFVITPPLFRLDPGQQNSLRIVRVGGELPEYRESVFMLNVKSIPSSKQSEANQLQITVKSQLKLFYRPAALKVQNADESYKALTFSRQGNYLQVTNPTPFYVSFYSVKVGGVAIENPEMVAPQGTLQWPVTVPADSTITWQAITDFGGITPPANTNL
ncbi:fimbrial assembly protein [Pseudomonas sp. IB20]|uniref:fimbrial biogenesis chaperone n=1 Tax=Pseudomonas TaxID=286 RepID=UPI000BA085E2|nr:MULTISPECIES: molecular chaperone [unclassified Pseudomonas]MCV2228094.1 molecular chaperone [Pseudomonas sp. AU10]OZO03142.1 fimbrial assembly protein [Pseudomonas sp. IB20]